MSNIEISVNNQFSAQKEIKKLVDDAETVLNQQIQLAMADIKDKASQGMGVDRAFGGYSNSYKNAKNNKGKKNPNSGHLPGRGDQVTLRDTGQMMESMVTSVERTATSIIAKIFFNQPRSNRGASGKGPTLTNSEVARFVEASSKYRKFFALSKKQIDKIINALQRK